MKLSSAIDQTKQFESPYQEALLSFLYVAKQVENHHKDFFKQFDITMQQYNVLRILKGVHPKVCNVKYIRDRLIDKDSDASRLLDRMAKKELVLAIPNNTDKRHLDLCLTQQGWQKLEEIAPYISETDAQFRVFDVVEIGQFTQLLEKMIDPALK
jgi:MarR family transcriptional regulator, multiple gene regulator MgrA